VLGRLLLSDISRNLPADKPVDVSDGRQQGLGDLRFVPVRSCCRCRPPDYPTLPTQPESSGTIDGSTFTQAVAQVAIAADRGRHAADPDRRARRDRGREGHLPGHRPLPAGHARVHLEPQRRTDASHVALIPARTLAETARGARVRVARWPSRSATAAGGDGLVGFEAGQRHSTSRLLDGEYPKVSKIFPTTSETEAVVKTADLVEAVKRVALVAERNTPVRLRFSDGQVAIEAGAGDDAQASEAVEASVDGPEIEIAFNPALPSRRARRAAHALCAVELHSGAEAGDAQTGQSKWTGRRT
jgi:DNA polymerase-3 subunit beta